MKMRDDMVANDYAGQPASVLKRRRREWRRLTPEVRELIGEVLIASAWLEETTNTFLQNRYGTWVARAAKYGTAASSLADGIESFPETKHLAQRFREAMAKRNYLAHGVILMIPGPQPLWSLKHQMTYRQDRTSGEPPVREEWYFGIEDLESLVDEIWEIQDELKMESDALRRA